MINPRQFNLKDLLGEWDEDKLEPHDQKAVEIVKKNMYWALGVGFIPIPLLDIAAVTIIQLDMLKELCKHYGVPYSELKGKAILSAISGAAIARYWASFIKAIPVFGSAIGGMSMAVLSAASTYALGRVFMRYLSEGLNLDTIDASSAKAMYEEELKNGKKYAESMQANAKRNVYWQIEQLAALREKGLLTEEEFEAKKQELLGRI